MPDLTMDEMTLALAVVGAVALIAFLLAAVLAARLRRLRKQAAMIRGEAGDRDILAAFGAAVKRIEALGNRLDEAVETQRAHAERTRLSVQKFGIVRYDAFEEMGGRLSFSAALLDDHGDGLVLTSINGRTETRTYAKPVKALSSSHNLSGEEQEAIAAAVALHDRSQSPAAATR